MVRRAEQSGYAALVLTVDAPVAGIRNREHRAGFSLPANVSAANFRGDTPFSSTDTVAGGSIVFDGFMACAPTWNDIDWLVSSTRLPVIVKGILNPDDAKEALNHGVAGIVVSNHGGRILDTLPASIEALPLIADAIAGRIPILLDSGIRRGSDVFKALALGASAVLVGRPYIHALATAGALGVAHVLRILREELEINMALSGCATLESINKNTLFSF